MRYINVKTGNVIDVTCLVSGGDWKPLEEPKQKTTAAKKTAKTAPKSDAE